jgi:hypothetical protein
MIRLPAADVLVRGIIPHDCELATKRQLVKEAYDEMPDGGHRDPFV